MKFEFDDSNNSGTSGDNKASRSSCQKCLGKENKKMNASVLTLGIAICVCLIGYAVFASESSETNNTSTLKLISIIFRHGSRLPIGTYNSDPYKNYKWEQPPGSLTNRGKQEAYELGLKIRKRYSKFLPDDYNESDIYVKSSALSRTLTSAYSLLAGLYPPTAKDMWNPNILWQPIPVFSVPRNIDRFIAAKQPCGLYEQHYSKAKTSPEMKKINEKHRQLFANLTFHCNETMETIQRVELLYNCLKVQRENGLILPNWTEGIFPDRMKEITAESYLFFTHDTVMKRLRSGPLLSEILTNMQLKDSGHLTPHGKMLLYSGHDITIVGLWNTIGFTEYLLPDYGASLTFELHAIPGSGDSEVKVLYSNRFNEEPHLLKLPACESPCKLTMFAEVMKNVLPLDWKEECKATESFT